MHICGDFIQSDVEFLTFNFADVLLSTPHEPKCMGLQSDSQLHYWFVVRKAEVQKFPAVCHWYPASCNEADHPDRPGAFEL